MQYAIFSGDPIVRHSACYLHRTSDTSVPRRYGPKNPATQAEPIEILLSMACNVEFVKKMVRKGKEGCNCLISQVVW
jgi:hypothetical protein